MIINKFLFTILIIYMFIASSLKAQDHAVGLEASFFRYEHINNNNNSSFASTGIKTFYMGYWGISSSASIVKVGLSSITYNSSPGDGIINGPSSKIEETAFTLELGNRYYFQEELQAWFTGFLAEGIFAESIINVRAGFDFGYTFNITKNPKIAISPSICGFISVGTDRSEVSNTIVGFNIAPTLSAHFTF